MNGSVWFGVVLGSTTHDTWKLGWPSKKASNDVYEARFLQWIPTGLTKATEPPNSENEESGVPLGGP